MLKTTCLGYGESIASNSQKRSHEEHDIEPSVYKGQKWEWEKKTTQEESVQGWICGNQNLEMSMPNL